MASIDFSSNSWFISVEEFESAISTKNVTKIKFTIDFYNKNDISGTILTMNRNHLSS